LALLFGFALKASAGAVNFTFAHFIPPNEPGAEVGLWLEKDLNQKLKDRVRAKYFHSGQMGNGIEIVKKVRMGTLKGAFLTGNYAPELNPKFGIGTLAYCMDSYAKWEAFLDNNSLRTELFTSLEPKGILVLDMCYFGTYGFATTKPVQTLEDLKSFKMRTTQARYPLAFWNALGVNPVPMAWGAVFPALKQGVVDGTDQTENVTRLRLADVCKYYTRTKHMVGLFFLVVNKKWWNALDDDLRQSMALIIRKNVAKARQASVELTKKAPEALKAKGVKVMDLSPTEMAKFKASQKSVWKKFESEIGAKWLAKVSDLAARVDAK
jgi:TRAP-type C4-dicarboxylate transport system substrate-binding protein